MKKILLLAVLMLFIGCRGGDTVPETKEESANGTRTNSISSFTLPIVGLDNLIIRDVIPPQSASNVQFSKVMFADNPSGNIFTNDSGVIFPVELPPGVLAKATHSVAGAPNKIALTMYVDATDDTWIATCVLSTEDGLCDPEEYEPRKMSGLGNSPFYQQSGDIIRYLTGSSFVEETVSTGVKVVTPFASNGMISINPGNDHIMIFDGARTKLKGTSDIEVPDTIIDFTFGHIDGLFPNQNRFFLPHKSGFLIKGGTYNDFYRVVDNGGVLESRMAQENEYYDVSVFGIGSFNRIILGSDLSGCTYHVVGDDDLMVCNDVIYNLGDQSNDISRKNINYSGHSIFDLTIKAGNSIYFYSKNNNDGSENLFRLSKEDVINNTTTTITENYKIIPNCFDVNKGETDTLDIGAYRKSDNVQVVLKITDANVLPVISETVGECSQIVSF